MKVVLPLLGYTRAPQRDLTLRYYKQVYGLIKEIEMRP
jgi:hypothetical protein